uniref:Thyroid peroxidase n=1 Tax=Sinocyclocheilus anshuiensis TaxID=1608454 RepID=A0A671M6Q2_9TELE
MHSYCVFRKSPLWGAASTGLARWLPAEYEDGENQPKGWNTSQYSGFQLPLVNKHWRRGIMRFPCMAILEDSAYSQMLVDWGQYIDHDISYTPQISSQSTFSSGRDCLHTCSNAEPCFPMQALTPRVKEQVTACLPFFRSSPTCINIQTDVRPAGQRQQMNSVTSFIDVSTVYGPSADLEKTLRNLSSAEGLLAVNSEYSEDGQLYLPFVSVQPSACLQEPGTGRVLHGRVNEILPLSVLHTLRVREHNRLVIYQEIIITTRDYIPKIMGREAFDEYLGPYAGYDDSVNPSVSNVFATTQRELPGTPLVLCSSGGLDPVLRGLLDRPAALQNQEHLMTEDLTQRLLVLNIPETLDLAALNLQRGRDHGLPGYNDWRAFCGFDRVDTRSDLIEVVGSGVLVEKIMDVYGHLDNINVCPLFACLIGKQMKTLREGDRFAVVVRLLRDGGSPQSVQTGIFLFCGNVPSMDLEAWREPPHDGTYMT